LYWAASSALRLVSTVAMVVARDVDVMALARVWALLARVGVTTAVKATLKAVRRAADATEVTEQPALKVVEAAVVFVAAMESTMPISEP